MTTSRLVEYMNVSFPKEDYINTVIPLPLMQVLTVTGETQKIFACSFVPLSLSSPVGGFQSSIQVLQTNLITRMYSRVQV